MFEDLEVDNTFFLTRIDPRLIENKLSSLDTTETVKKAMRRCFEFYPTERAESQEIVEILEESEQMKLPIVKTRRCGQLFELPKRTIERMKKRTLLEYLLYIQKWPENVESADALTQAVKKCFSDIVVHTKAPLKKLVWLENGIKYKKTIFQDVRNWLFQNRS